MRKEALIAILLGCLLGLTLAFGVWRASKTLKQTENKEQQPTIKIDKKEKESNNLLVTSPETGAVVSNDTVTVQGATKPHATIVIVASAGEIISQAKEDGSFSEEVKLVGGPNEIKVTAYDQDGNKFQKTLTIVYSTEFPKQ